MLKELELYTTKLFNLLYIVPHNHLWGKWRHNSHKQYMTPQYYLSKKYYEFESGERRKTANHNLSKGGWGKILRLKKGLQIKLIARQDK